jgi:hypothetical protein
MPREPDESTDLFAQDPVIAPMSDAMLDLCRPVAERLAAALGRTATLREGTWDCGHGVVIDRHGLRSPGLYLTWTALEIAGDPARLSRFTAVVRELADLPRGVRRTLDLPDAPGRRLERRGSTAWWLVSAWGWQTSYSLGEGERALLAVDGRRLPRGDAGRELARRLEHMLEPLPNEPAPPLPPCRFCGGMFDACDFLAHEQACHGCAEVHLGVVF